MFNGVWPSFSGGADLAARGTGSDKTWRGLFDFLIRDERATELRWEWEEGGEPHPAKSLSEMLDWFEKGKWRTGEVAVRRDTLGQIVGLTFCGTEVLAGCTVHINHSGLRIEITSAKALLPHLQAIESSVTRLLDDWSN